jgi:hypothetical protein
MFFEVGSIDPISDAIVVKERQRRPHSNRGSAVESIAKDLPDLGAQHPAGTENQHAHGGVLPPRDRDASVYSEGRFMRPGLRALDDIPAGTASIDKEDQRARLRVRDLSDRPSQDKPR